MIANLPSASGAAISKIPGSVVPGPAGMPLGGFTGVVRVAEGVGDGDRGVAEADVGGR